MHPRSEHSTCDAPKAPDDAPECNEIALGVTKHAYAHKSFSRDKGGTWSAPKASDDAPRCMRSRLSRNAYSHKSCICSQNTAPVMLPRPPTTRPSA